MLNMEQFKRDVTQDLEDDLCAALSRTSRSGGSVSDCQWEDGGWCTAPNPKICLQSEKVHKTKKHEVQQWVCGAAI